MISPETDKSGGGKSQGWRGWQGSWSKGWSGKWPGNWSHSDTSTVETLLPQPTRREQAEARREKDKYQPSGPTIELPERLGTLTLAIRPVSTMALTTVSSLEESMAFFDRRRGTTIQREKVQPTTLVKEIPYIGTHATIKEPMADVTSTTETIETTESIRPVSPELPTPAQVLAETQPVGSERIAPQPEQQGWFGRMKKKVVLATAAAMVAVAGVAGVVTAKFGGSRSADNPQPQNAPTQTVPSSETSKGVYDQVVVPVAQTEQPKPTPTLAPGIGGANPLPTFEANSPKSNINPLIDKFNAGENLSNAEKNEITQALTSPYQQTPEGIVYKNQEKEIAIPKIDGLKTEIKGDKVVYVNKEGQPVGIFHAETFEVRPEGQSQTGMIVLKPEITTSLLQAQRANNNPVIAVPFDPTTATKEGKLIIQNTATRSGSQQVTFQVPDGSTLINSTDNNSTQTIINPQSWGGATVRLQSNLLGRYEAIITTADPLKRATITTEPGNPIAIISGRPFSGEVRTLLNRWLPQPVDGTNAYLDIKQGFTEPDGSLPSLKVTTSNLLRIGETFVSTLSSDNIK